MVSNSGAQRTFCGDANHRVGTPDQSSQVCAAGREWCGGDIIDPRALCRSLVRICLASLPAAKTEFKAIASKMIQHPTVTIERIRPRRRVIELSVQARLSGAAVPREAATPNRTVRMAWRGYVSVRPNRTTATTLGVRKAPATKLAR